MAVITPVTISPSIVLLCGAADPTLASAESWHRLCLANRPIAAHEITFADSAACQTDPS